MSGQARGWRNEDPELRVGGGGPAEGLATWWRSLILVLLCGHGSFKNWTEGASLFLLRFLWVHGIIGSLLYRISNRHPAGGPVGDDLFEGRKKEDIPRMTHSLKGDEAHSWHNVEDEIWELVGRIWCAPTAAAIIWTCIILSYLMSY